MLHGAGGPLPSSEFGLNKSFWILGEFLELHHNGVGSVLAGGNFWAGVRQGAISTVGTDSNPRTYST
nr:hypothetical protein [uncultured Allomuricauda sp.]